MFTVPLTYWANFSLDDELARRQTLREFADNGAKNLTLSEPVISKIMGDHTFAAAIRNEMAECGLTFVDAHAPFGGVLDMNCPDMDFRPQMLLRHKLALEICASFGIGTITIHPGSDRFFPEIPLEKHWDLMRDALDKLLPEAERLGIAVAIENSMSRAASPSAVVMLKSEYPTDTLGLCFDSGHANVLDHGRNYSSGMAYDFWRKVGCEPEWDDRIIEKMLPQMISCHLHDNDGSTDSHSLPGCGNVDWKKIVPLLKRAPRLMVVQSEVCLAPRYSVKQLCAAFEKLSAIE